MRARYPRSLSIFLAAFACGGERGEPPGQPAVITVADVGFQTPESALHDAVADVYLVSNINGAPAAKDDNGFISHVGTDGTIHALKWIDGAAVDVTLHAPKGMGIKGDTLFVADIDAVRVFDRASGRPLGSRAVPGATFLNDIAVGPDGIVYVSDSGLKPDFSPSGSDAIYRFDSTGTPVRLIADTALGRPNGLAADSASLTVVTFGSGAIFPIERATGRRGADLPKGPGGQLDGVVKLADGSLLVSSWEGKAVYQVHAGGHYMVVADSIEAPADIGYDAGRNRVLIPMFTTNRLVIRSMGSQQ